MKSKFMRCFTGVLFLLSILFVTGCKTQENQVSENPHPCYSVDLPEYKSVTDLFELHNQIDVSLTDGHSNEVFKVATLPSGNSVVWKKQGSTFVYVTDYDSDYVSDHIYTYSSKLLDHDLTFEEFKNTQYKEDLKDEE